MKKLFLITFLIMVIAGYQPVSAHAPGEPPFIKINGKYTDVYPLPAGKIVLDAPQEKAPEKYKTNEVITFEIDVKKYYLGSSDQIKGTTFYWKYGDGSLGTGTKNTHSYHQPGTYILKIFAKDEALQEPQLIESLEITIEPNETYSNKLSYAMISGVILFVTSATIGRKIKRRTV